MTTTLDRSIRISPPTNGDLVVAAGAGDRASWEELVNRHTGMLWSLARSFRLDEDDSADVVQSTWLRLAEQIHGLRDRHSVSGWLAATAHQECVQLLRRRRANRSARRRTTTSSATNPAPTSG
jgi:RNA polymerase sigma factor (sigma-70 family)